MHTLRHRLFGPRPAAWLLWLALLLPLAQGMATWHTLSHARTDLVDRQDGKALHASHCDLCLTAAAVAGGALPGHPPALPAAVVAHATPLARLVAAASPAPVLAYLSRAPPHASH